MPTAAPQWNVKDVALHILGGDVANLSRRRDGFSLAADLSSYEKLVAFINEINASWVKAGQRMSARVLMDLTEYLGRQADEHFAGLDPFAMGGAVSWAGDGPAPVWFDVAREYTERWHHQQQIRDATWRPGLYEQRLFEPVLDTFIRGLPHAFRGVEVADGVAVQFRVTGALQKEWCLVNRQNWKLFEGTLLKEEQTHASPPWRREGLAAARTARAQQCCARTTSGRRLRLRRTRRGRYLRGGFGGRRQCGARRFADSGSWGRKWRLGGTAKSVRARRMHRMCRGEHRTRDGKQTRFGCWGGWLSRVK